jgi:rubrerythrin
LAKNFKDLSEQEILALAISSEETDARIYADFAAGLNADYLATAQIFKEMEAEEDEHRRELIEEYRRRFGEHIPLIRREDVKGFVYRKPVWMIRPLGIKVVRRQAEIMETETRRFYERAASRVSDVSTRKLLGDLRSCLRSRHSGGLRRVAIGHALAQPRTTTTLAIKQFPLDSIAG